MKIVLMILTVLTYAGCATDISSNSYSEDHVGEAAPSYRGVVYLVRTVKVAPDQLGKSYVGMAAGGITGGIIGNQFGTGFGNELMTVAGAGVGLELASSGDLKPKRRWKSRSKCPTEI